MPKFEKCNSSLPPPFCERWASCTGALIILNFVKNPFFLLFLINIDFPLFQPPGVPLAHGSVLPNSGEMERNMLQRIFIILIAIFVLLFLQFGYWLLKFSKWFLNVIFLIQFFIFWTKFFYGDGMGHIWRYWYIVKGRGFSWGKK